MSLLSDSSTVIILNTATMQINRCFGIFIFLFGTIGNIINIFVLSEKNLRRNSCAWCFLVGSITSIIIFSSGLITRILSGWNFDYSETNDFICKIRSLFAFSFLTANFWLITLATIDRWLTSHLDIYYRQKSTLKNARRGSAIIICLSIGIYIQMLYCYEANLIHTPSKCYNRSTSCRLVTDLTLAIISVLLPLFLMMFFGLKTISNIRQSQRRTHHQQINTNEQQNQRKKLDRQLSLMLFIQVISLTIFSIPLPIQRLYTTFTDIQSKTNLQQAIDNFLYNLFVLFIYIANGISFYIYTISGGNTFRKALLTVFQTFRRIIFCQ